VWSRNRFKGLLLGGMLAATAAAVGPIFQPVWPVDTEPVRTAGNFGEIRGNHFHMGWDISTGGRRGVPVRAVERGRIVRIKVSSGGLGKALYIAHPNGYTTVYAHLKAFIPKVEAVVARRMRSLEKYEDDWWLKNSIPVEKGQVIAYSGNTGGSRSPHLHFEVRESTTEWAVNPAMVGFRIKDIRAPFFYSIALYPLDSHSVVRVTALDGHVRTATHGQRLRLRVHTRGGKAFYLPNVQSIQARGRIGLAFAGYDYQEDKFNRFGIFEKKLIVNGKPVFVMRADRLPFSLFRFVNAHIDYALKVREGKEYERLFRLPHNRLPFYKKLVNRGILTLDSTRAHVTIALKDEFGNASQLAFSILPLSADSAQTLARPMTPPDNLLKVMAPADELTHRTEGLSLYVPPYSVYDTTALTFSVDSACADCYSPVYRIGNPDIPVHRRFLLRITPERLPDRLRPYAYVARREGKRWSYAGGTWKGPALKARPRTFGAYAVRIDSLPPTMRFLTRQREIRFNRPRQLRVALSDRHTGIASYRVEVDSQFYYPAYWDAKIGVLKITLDTFLTKGRHQLTVKATDRLGNQRAVSIPIVRLP